MNNSLHAIKEFGQQIWLDNLSHHLLLSGELEQLVKQDGISGITSNPSIFYKAITTDQHYQDQLAKIKQISLSADERYEALVIPTVQDACDLLRAQYEASNGKEGYVSFELAPELANDAHGSILHAKRLWNTINRPNLMIKIPGTKAGTEALETLIACGMNINITLLFSIEQVQGVWDAYILGLIARHKAGKPLQHVHAVASFFLSRIDSAMDDKLPEHLQGKAAINLAKTVYALYQNIFEGEEFRTLKSAGANPQDLLWASTGTKNPKYSDVMYVENLIGPNTINTLPDATLAAFRDHGVAKLTLTENSAEAAKILAEVNTHVNMEQLGTQLQIDGLKLFADSFNALIKLVK